MLNIHQSVMDTITLELDGLQTKITTEAVEIFRPVSKHRMAVAWLPEDTLIATLTLKALGFVLPVQHWGGCFPCDKK